MRKRRFVSPIPNLKQKKNHPLRGGRTWKCKYRGHTRTFLVSILGDTLRN